jgi:hypothetical protein
VTLRYAGGAVILVGMLASFGSGTAAQPPDPDPPDAQFFSRVNFHLGAATLASGDPRFVWNADIGGDIDIVDYGRGRLNFLADYEVVLGTELQNFDPNQANYTLDVSASRRFPFAEIEARYHHLSRHISDRAKSFPIDWNAVGVRAVRRETRWGLRLQESASVEWVFKRSYVDYEWLIGFEAFLEPASQSRRVTPLTGGRLTLTTVDPSVAGRDTQVGAYWEAAARVTGKAGAIDFLVAVERRVDAGPFERQPRTWALVGFRLVSQPAP